MKTHFILNIGVLVTTMCIRVYSTSCSQSNFGHLLSTPGASGLLIGGISGIIRSPTPRLFAVASGLQWFILGTTFWGEHARSLFGDIPIDSDAFGSN
jgi:hypothetical protein